MAQTPEERRAYDRQYYQRNKVKRCAQMRNWWRVNRERGMDTNRKRLYGVPQGWYEEQLKKQEGRCGICGKVPRGKRKLAIDHDHVTGKVRGLLCDQCNITLERFETVPNFGHIVRGYLAEHEQ